MKLVQRRWHDIDKAFRGASIVTSFGGRIVAVLPEPTELGKSGLVVWFEVHIDQDVDALDAIIEGL